MEVEVEALASALLAPAVEFEAVEDGVEAAAASAANEPMDCSLEGSLLSI